MNLPATVETVPLRVDSDGVIRVSGTRVTLDTVVAAFEQGASAEEIAVQYPMLDLADIYSVLGYYLRNRAEVTKYLRTREAEATRIQQECEARFNLVGLRDRLLARVGARQ